MGSRRQDAPPRYIIRMISKNLRRAHCSLNIAPSLICVSESRILAHANENIGPWIAQGDIKLTQVVTSTRRAIF